jgi:hypothetical protein
MKTSGIFFMVAGLGLGLVSCAPPAVPQRPSWDVDVFPILQGSCNHCHGETVGNLPTQPLSRLDICDSEVFTKAGITLAAPTTALVWGAQFPNYVKPVAANKETRAKMPPPPAAELSDYERDVLVKWGTWTPEDPKDKCIKQGRNREPDMRVIGEPVWDGDTLKLTIEVWDPDLDQVLGKVSVGAVSGNIPASGRREIVITGANQNDPITVLLHDGYVSRTIGL